MTTAKLQKRDFPIPWKKHTGPRNKLGLSTASNIILDIAPNIIMKTQDCHTFLSL